jgi:hypothetical protein
MTLNKYLFVWLGIVLATVSTASAGWKEKVLYSFQGGLTDGSTPAGGVVFDKAGNLYGATTGGGPDSCAPIVNECGLVFELSPPAKGGDPWTETLIYQFKGKGFNDASAPAGGVLVDAGGNVYGTTAYGGTGDCVLLGTKAGCGTVFELSPPAQKGGAWTETILYSFKSGKDGYFPAGDLTFDANGNLYGATLFGGGKGTTCNPYYQYCGTVFELSPPKQKGGSWTEKVLHSFGSGKDGVNPNGGLIFDSKGAIYGSTSAGGGNPNPNCQSGTDVGCGTVFKLSPPKTKGGAWSERLLYSFRGRPKDGQGPNGSLVFDAKGALYGTGGGGSQEFGVVFQLAPPGKGSRDWRETLILTFGLHNDLCYANDGPVSDSSGYLYGVAGCGAYNRGAVYRLAPPKTQHGGWSLSTLYDFKGAPDAGYPESSLTFGAGRNLYGTTQSDGTGTGCQGGCGTVFEVSP